MSEEGPGSGLSPDMIEKQYLGENITENLKFKIQKGAFASKSLSSEWEP